MAMTRETPRVRVKKRVRSRDGLWGYDLFLTSAAHL